MKKNNQLNALIVFLVRITITNKNITNNSVIFDLSNVNVSVILTNVVKYFLFHYLHVLYMNRCICVL